VQPLADLPRVWSGTYLPGYHDWGARFPPTYAGFPSDWLPPIERDLDDGLRWLLQSHRLAGKAVALPPSFASFFGSEEPRKRIRSCTDCYLEFPEFVVPYGEGWLIDFLSDSQSVVCWLLYTGSDGEAVVATEYPQSSE
jgi:hypothetical protein